MTTALVLYDPVFAAAQQRAIVEPAEVVDGEHVREQSSFYDPITMFGIRIRTNMTFMTMPAMRVSVQPSPKMGIKAGISLREMGEALDKLAINARPIESVRRELESGQ